MLTGGGQRQGEPPPTDLVAVVDARHARVGKKEARSHLGRGRRESRERGKTPHESRRGVHTELKQRSTPRAALQRTRAMAVLPLTTEQKRRVSWLSSRFSWHSWMFQGTVARASQSQRARHVARRRAAECGKNKRAVSGASPACVAACHAARPTKLGRVNVNRVLVEVDEAQKGPDLREKM